MWRFLLLLMLIGCSTVAPSSDILLTEVHGPNAAKVTKANLQEVAGVFSTFEGYESTNWKGLLYLYSDGYPENEELVDVGFYYSLHKVVLLTSNGTDKRTYEFVFEGDGVKEIDSLRAAYKMPRN